MIRVIVDGLIDRDIDFDMGDQGKITSDEFRSYWDHMDGRQPYPLDEIFEYVSRITGVSTTDIDMWNNRVLDTFTGQLN